MGKVWKKEPLTFEQFGDMWEQNNKLEVARSLLTMLKDSKSIPDGQKLIFLAGISIPVSTPYKGLASLGLLPEYRFTSEDRELGAIAVRFFLEIMPGWDNNAFKKECEAILSALGSLPVGEQSGWESKIKAFIHSLLDTIKKENSFFWKYDVPQALVNNRMLEEMVNYDIIEDSGLKYLI